MLEAHEKRQKSKNCKQAPTDIIKGTDTHDNDANESVMYRRPDGRRRAGGWHSCCMGHTGQNKTQKERRRDSSIGQEDSISVGAWWSRSCGGRGKEASSRTIIREGAVVGRRGRSRHGGMLTWPIPLHGKSASGNAQDRLLSHPFYAGRQSRGTAGPGLKKNLAANGPALIGRTIAV